MWLLTGCGEPEAPPEPVVVEPSDEPVEAPASTPAPRHDGTVVRIDPHAVEVVVHDAGEVEGYFVSPDPPPHTHVLLTVRLPGDDGRIHPVILQWNPIGQRYEGRLREVRPIPGSVEVVLDIDGHITRGRASSVVVRDFAGNPPPVARRPASAPSVVTPPAVPLVELRPPDRLRRHARADTESPPVAPPVPPPAPPPANETPTTRVVLHGRTERPEASPPPEPSSPRRIRVR